MRGKLGEKEKKNKRYTLKGPECHHTFEGSRETYHWYHSFEQIFMVHSVILAYQCTVFINKHLLPSNPL